MKKLLFFISAMAGLFFAASCEREEMAPASENAVVTYSVEIPEIATRAIGDDVSNINDLVYAVYCTEAESLEDAQTNGGLQLLYQKNYTSNPFDGGKAIISVELVNDKNYLIVFWAQNEEKWVAGTSFDLTQPIVCNPTLTANDENLAAFSGVDFLKSDNLAVKRELKLKRAVAQINVATTLAENFEITPTQSKVVVKNAGAQFNVVKQIAEGNADITFETANVPDGNLTVNSTGYKYAAMNYIFANGNVEVDYEISYTTGTDVAGTVKNTVPGVPVAQNYRTNIIGSLLTSQADYDVVLDDFSVNGNSGNIEVLTEGIVKNQYGDYEISSPNGMAFAMNNLWAQYGGTYYVVKSVDMLPYFQNGNLTIPSIPAGKTLNVYTAVPVVTRSTDAITITGLPFLINTVEAGANVSLQGVTMAGTDTESLINTVEQGANVVLSDCSVNDQDDMAELVETGADFVVDATEVNDEYSLKAALATGINEFTITADFVTEEVNLIAKSVIINGNHKTITSNATRAFRVTTKDVNVTFNNLNVNVATERKGTNDVRGIAIDPSLSNISLTLNNCSVEFTHPSANDWAYAVNVAGSGTNHKVTIDGGKYYGANVVNVYGANNVITIKNAELNCTYPNSDMYCGACVWVQQEMGSSVYAEGNTFNGDNAIAFNLGTGTALEEKDNTDNTKGLSVNGDKYTIHSINGLKWLAEQVNGGNDFKGKTVVLASNINLNNQEWTPIGSADKPFRGIFDGQGKTVKNLTITGYNSNVGLFGHTTDGEIKNLTVENAKVSGRLNVGVVSGTPYTSKYTDITVKGHVEVNGMAYVGGVGGKNAYADWTNITVNVDETSYVNANSVENGTAYRTYVGGVVGFNGEGGHTFKNISSNIDVKGSTCDVGGLFGIAHYGNNFEDCSCSGNVEIYAAAEAEDAEEIGGIAGVWHNENGTMVTMTNVSFTGNVVTNINRNTVWYNNLVGKAYGDGDGKLVLDGIQLTKDGVILASINNILKTNDFSFPFDIRGKMESSNGYGGTGIRNDNYKTIDGQGKVLNVIGANGTWDSAIATKGGTIKNLTVASGFRGIFIMKGTERVILENVTVDGPTYTISCDEAGKQGLTALNSTFNGWTSYAGTIGEAYFENCSFGFGAGYKYARPYAPTTFENCNFCEGYTIDARAKVALINCTLNGKKITNENLSELVTSNIANASVPVGNIADLQSVLNSDATNVVLAKAIVVESGDITLDLNGKTIIAEKSSAFEVKGGQLTLKNGKVEAYESTVRAIGGKVVIESGEYTSTGTALDNPATYRYSLDCREGGELIINGGTFKSNNGMINVSSKVTINGGKFENIVEKSMTRHFAYVSALLTINDGEFLGKANSSAGGCFFCGAAAGGDIQINGGKFTSLWTSGSVNRIFEVYYGGKINVTGGMFNTNGGITSFVTENTDEATKAQYPYIAK